MNNIIKYYWQPIIIVILLIVAHFFIPLSFLIEVMLFSIFVMGCNFLLGYGGLLSFGQPLYLGVGLYATALYLTYIGQNPIVGIVMGIFVGLLFGFIIGSIIVHLRSDYFALANAALNVIGFFMIYDILADITNGLDGLWFLTRITPISILSLSIDLSNMYHFFIFTIIIFFMVLILTSYIMKSVFGSICLACINNEDKVRFLGYSVFKVKLIAFIYATLLSALAGSMYAISFGFVCPTMMGQEKAGEIVATTLLGGVGTLLGPIIGSIIIVATKDLASNIIEHWEVLMGILLILIVLKGERGIVGIVNDLYKIEILRKFKNNKGD